MALADWTPLGVLFLLAAAGGIAIAFEGPNRHALVYQLVGKEGLPNAVALNSSMFNAGRAVGPACGGILIAIAGVGWCFALNAASFAAILAALMLMRVDELYPVRRGERVGAFASIRQGLGFIRTSHVARVVIGLLMVSTLIGFNFRVLVPVLAERKLHVGPGMFGVLYACFGAGALIGALVTASVGRASPRLFIAGGLALNLGVVLTTLTRSELVSAMLLLLAGCGFSTWLSTGQSILQLAAPDHLRGRVLSVYLLVVGGLQPFGALLAGWLTQKGGPDLAFGVAGGTGLVATLVAMNRFRAAPRTAHSEATVSAA
jgi:MFS family permease